VDERLSLITPTDLDVSPLKIFLIRLETGEAPAEFVAQFEEAMRALRGLIGRSSKSRRILICTARSELVWPIPLGLSRPILTTSEASRSSS
jgi:hypothetical protein